MTNLTVQVRRPNWNMLADWGERFAVSLLFAWFVSRLSASALSGHWPNLLVLASESLVFVFVLFRRSTTEVTRSPRDWALAVGATVGPLLVQAAPLGSALAPMLFCVALIVAGLLLQVAAKLTLRRSFGIVAANRGVKSEGPYRFLRHPMYAGYLLTHVGFLLANPTLWNAAVYAASASLQVARLLAEERLLAKDPKYAALQSAVRWRLIPGVF